MKFRKIATCTLCIFSLVGLAQCGDKTSKSKDVRFTLSPDNPIVINADLTLNAGQDNERVIAAPWFLFSSRVVNNSDSTLFLQSYTLTVSAIKDGQTVTKSMSIDPAVTCDDSTEARVYIAIIPAGTTYTGLNPSPALPDYCDPADIVSTAAESWYIDALPDADDFFYTVEVKGEGWFVNGDGVAIERLILNGQMFTQ